MEYLQARWDISRVAPRYAVEYQALIEVGATHEEAVAQIAQSNEVEVSQVEVKCVSHWAE
jgi:hypothetical protein